MRVCWFFALVLMLSSCATVQEKSLITYRLADMQYLKEKTNWFCVGRLAVSDGKDSNTISISWRHVSHQDNIELSGPLGQGRVVVVVDPDKVTVDDGEIKQSYSGNAENVISDLLGVNVPYNALKWWVLGVDDPDLQVIAQDDGFIQDDWLIRYSELQEVGAGRLPKKVMASKGAVKIKLVIDLWEL